MLPTVIMVNSHQQHFWHESEILDHSPSSCILVVIMVHNNTAKVINIVHPSLCSVIYIFGKSSEIMNPAICSLMTSFYIM